MKTNGIGNGDEGKNGEMDEREMTKKDDEDKKPTRNGSDDDNGGDESSQNQNDLAMAVRSKSILNHSSSARPVSPIHSTHKAFYSPHHLSSKKLLKTIFPHLHPSHRNASSHHNFPLHHSSSPNHLPLSYLPQTSSSMQQHSSRRYQHVTTSTSNQLEITIFQNSKIFDHLFFFHFEGEIKFRHVISFYFIIDQASI